MAYRRVQFLMLTVLVAVSVTAGMFLASGLDLTPSAAAQEASALSREVPPAYSLPNFADIAERANPAVVSITSSAVVDPRNSGRSLLRDFFFGPEHREEGEGDDEGRLQQSGGSGFIISEDGYILTNYHVIEDADRVQVRLENESRQFLAKVVGTDRLTDLALLKIDVGRRLPTIPLGDSNRVRVGEWVVAIGNPLFWDHTVTVGVISAVGRRLPRGDPNGRDPSFDNFLQTDAAINFGNSGGPLLNLYGEAIGINTAISRVGQGIGFTIPINMAKQIVDQLKENGRVARGFLGIEIRDIAAMDADQREFFHLADQHGAFVNNVTRGLPGAVSGMRRGDAVVEVDGKPIDSSQELINEITGRSPGDSARLTIIRDGERLQLTAHLVDREQASAEEVVPARDEEHPEALDTEDVLGFTVSSIEPQNMRYYELDRNTEGVVVTSSDPFSDAYDKGLREGTVILEVNRKRVRSLNEFRREVRSLDPGDLVNFYVQTGEIKRFVTLRFGEAAG